MVSSVPSWVQAQDDLSERCSIRSNRTDYKITEISGVDADCAGRWSLMTKATAATAWC